MCSPKVQVVLIGIVYAFFVYFLFSGNEFLAECFSSLMLPLITLGYFCSVKNKSIYFVLFLVIYSISDLLIIFSGNLPLLLDYFIGNTLYIIAYTFLIVEIAKNLNFSYIFKNYKFSILVLFILNFYISYQLLRIVTPDHSFHALFYTEMIYNVVMLLILSFALLNYIIKDSRKAFYILIGSLCIVFSEVLNIAYWYVSQQSLLNLLAISIGLTGFYFLYQQAKLNYKKRDKILY